MKTEINKKLRKQVRNKFNGRCAFCGCELTSMRISPITPIKFAVNESGDLVPTNLVFENLYPSCLSCAAIRSKYEDIMDIEAFRANLAQSFRFLQSGSATGNSYAMAIRFGLIVETNAPIVFYFEKHPVNNP